ANEEENHALVADEEAPIEFALMSKSSTDNEIFDNSLCSKACKKNTDSLNSKITELSKKLGDTKNMLYHYKLGYSAVSPPAQVYSPPKKDMSWTGLPEFTDDTITDYTRPSPSVKSNLNDLQNNSSSISENGESHSSILSKPEIKFVKPADSPTVVKTDKKETVRKPSIKYAEMYKKTSKRSNGNSQINIDDKGYWDNGCSRHMTGNISYLSDYEPYDVGYVSFGQGGCKITGKQHKASYKTKLVNSVTKPFYTLHMDLFSPTSTIGILRNFITEIKNLKELRVKIIRNKEMNDFCSQKGIKREFRNARTPQQNGVAERRNRTLIEAARTMVFNKRTRRVEENLHVEFLENNAIEKSAGPNWLFDIDSLTKSMNYGPVDAETISTNLSVKPKKISDALQDPSWVEAMQEELLQFKIQNVWTLVDCPKWVRPIGTKWVLKNKKDERGIVIRNKARLVGQRHTQEEGIDYDEVFVPVARIGAIKLFLAYASFMGFTVYQMDVKSAFLYGTIDEEVGTIDQTLFIRKQREVFILVQVNVDDIIFGSSNPQLCREFEALMHKKFQMSAMDVRFLNTPMDKENPWVKDGTGKDVDLHLYRSMIESLMYLTASRPDIMFAVCACARH
nr:hypothetical protein [Tanacetum cinerariifolium]